MKRWSVVALAAVALAGTGMAARAEAGDWKVEVTPYVWFAGIDGTVTVGGREVKFDRSYDQLTENVDTVLEGVAIVQYRKFIGFVEVNTVSIKKVRDEFSQPDAGLDLEEVQLDMSGVTLGAGYQFPSFKRGTVDVLLGLRMLDLYGKVTGHEGGAADASNTVLDPALIIRPSFPLTAKLRINPTVAIGGGGDSDLIAAFSPQLQYSFNKTIAVRLGYRVLHQKYENDKGVGIDLNVSGVMAGVSLFF